MKLKGATMGRRNPVTIIILILVLGYGISIFWLNNVQKKSIALAQAKIANLGDINQDSDVNKLRTALTQLPEAIDILEGFDITVEVDIVSAHRTPEKLFEYANNAHKRDIKVIVAGAGGAANAAGAAGDERDYDD